MIIWFLDRFGLPGRYFNIWQGLLHMHGIRPSAVKTYSLHRELSGQLLQRHGSRKAPTWVPERGPQIIHRIQELIDQHKPEAVVLAAPESLACLGLHPDHATLHNLRGSVYWRDDVPHIVMLPMSAWSAVVSQREIGAANYGFESQDQLTEGSAAIARTVDSSRSRISGFVAGVRSATSEAGGNDSGPGGHETGSSVHGDLPAEHDRTHGGGSDGPGDGEGHDSIGDRGSPESGGGEEELATAGEVDNGLDPADGDVREDTGPDADGDGESDSSSELDEPDEETDQFFYEPVLSPVGRFALTADVSKLRRILEHRRASKGLSSPIVLKYR